MPLAYRLLPFQNYLRSCTIGRVGIVKLERLFEFISLENCMTFVTREEQFYGNLKEIISKQLLSLSNTRLKKFLFPGMYNVSYDNRFKMKTLKSLVENLFPFIIQNGEKHCFELVIIMIVGLYYISSVVLIQAQWYCTFSHFMHLQTWISDTHFCGLHFVLFLTSSITTPTRDRVLKRSF